MVSRSNSQAKMGKWRPRAVNAQENPFSRALGDTERGSAWPNELRGFCAIDVRLTLTTMDFDAVRRLLPPMSDDEFGAWLRRHVLDGIQEGLAADMRPAYYAALEVVHNSDQRLDNMLRALRDATHVETTDRQVLIAHLEKLMDRLCIKTPTTPALQATPDLATREASSEGWPDDCAPGSLDDLLVQISPENRHTLALDDGAPVGGEAVSAERWLVENRDALDSSDSFVEEHGLPMSLPRRDKPLTPSSPAD